VTTRQLAEAIGQALDVPARGLPRTESKPCGRVLDRICGLRQPRLKREAQRRTRLAASTKVWVAGGYHNGIVL